LADLLDEYKEKSPLIKLLYRLAINQIDTTEKTIQINRRALSEEKLRLEINKFIKSVYAGSMSQKVILLDETEAMLTDSSRQMIEYQKFATLPIKLNEAK